MQVITSPETRIDGLIVSNTTISREGLVGASREEAGGLSGAPLTEKSTKVCSKIFVDALKHWSLF